MFPISLSSPWRRDSRKNARRDRRGNRVRNRVDFGRTIELEPLEKRVVLTGTWTSVLHNMPDNKDVGLMILLTDGTIMAKENNTTKAWYKLSPDSNGNYANGTWTTLAPMNQTRLYFSSNVLPDGRVLVIGGEFSDAGKDTSTGEIYNPLTNTWTVIANGPTLLGDVESTLLPDGNVLVSDRLSPATFIYNVSANTWSAGALRLHNDIGAEESWVKLSDGSILIYAIGGERPQSGQRLVLDPNNNHANDKWYDAGSVPVRLDTTGGNPNISPEIGPAVRLADGRVFFIGASGKTALYTSPSTLTGTGNWVQGPDLLNTAGAMDSPAAVEVNGKVLVASGPIDGTFPGPTTLQEYDPVSNTMAIVPTVGGTNITPGPDLKNQPYTWNMLDLPNGQVLVANGTNSLTLYNPDGMQVSGVAPTITDIKCLGGTTFKLSGTQLNGFSEGAAYGDDAQMATNFPIVSLSDAAGHVYYARTTYWSNVGVGTGSTPVTVNFKLPAGLSAGTYGLQVSASGVRSNSVVLVVGTAGDDTLTMDTSAGGFLSFNLNGRALSDWYGNIAGVYLAMLDGKNTINILDTYVESPVTVAGAGVDMVNLGKNGNTQGLRGSIRVENFSSYNALNINNKADTTGRTVTLDTFNALDGQWGSIVGLTPGGVSYKYSDTRGLNITNGSGDDTTTVNATNGLPGALTTIDGYKGNDLVKIGYSTATLTGLIGPVAVAQTSGAGSTSLQIDDHNDTAARVIAVTDSSITAPGLPTITYNPAQVGALTFLAGSGGNIMNVKSTGGLTTTTISPGGGNNSVNVQSTAGPLIIKNTSNSQKNVDTVLIGGNAPLGGGSLSGIVGPVTVANVSGTDVLTVDDSNDSTARTYNINRTAMGGAGLPTILYSSLTSLTLNGGSGGNTFNISGTAPNTSGYSANTTINTGSRADLVNIAATHGNLAIQGMNGADTVTIGGFAPALGGTLTSIGGSISLANALGSIGLIVDDSGDVIARNSIVTSSSITGLAPYPITYGNLSNLSVRTSRAGGSSTNVQTTIVPTSIIGSSPSGGPDDTALVGVGGSLAGIAAALNFTNSPGFTSIAVDGSSDSAKETVAVTDHSIAGMSPGLISYVQNQSHLVSIKSGGGGNTFYVTSTGPVPTLSISTGTGVDQVNIGDAANTINSILGNLSVVKGAGSAFLAVNDQGTTAGQKYTLTANSFGRSGAGAIAFKGVNTIVLNTGISGDTYTLTDTPTANLSLNDLGGTNSLSGPNLASVWNIIGTNKVRIGTLSATNIQSLIGGTDIDTFVFSAGALLTGSLNGGGGAGRNWIDLSAYTTNVTVNLATGISTGVGGAISNIQDVRGGSGNDILTGNSVGNVLVGGAGNDTIVGGAGRSLLIGGSGVDNVGGGAGDDIVIGGFSTFDNNNAALDSILAEWQSAVDSYVTRINFIKNGGGLNGTNTLNLGTTVIDDLAANVLSGGAGNDWFFKGRNDGITDFATGERVN